MSNHTDIAANETLRQLGGGARLKAMLGLKLCAYADGGKTLVLGFPNRVGPNGARITLNGNDLYDIKLTRVHGAKVTELEPLTDIGVEALIPTLQKATGLAWRL